MKVSAKQYALLIKDIEEDDVDESSKETKLKKLAMIMIKNRDAKKISSIERIYQQQKKKGNGIFEVTVKSPIELSAEQISDVKNGLSRKYEIKGENIRIKNIIDENIIGGLVFSLEGEIIDDSLRNRILKINQALG